MVLAAVLACLGPLSGVVLIYCSQGHRHEGKCFVDDCIIIYVDVNG